MKMDDWRVVMLEGRVIRHQITFAIQPCLSANQNYLPTILSALLLKSPYKVKELEQLRTEVNIYRVTYKAAK